MFFVHRAREDYQLSLVRLSFRALLAGKKRLSDAEPAGRRLSSISARFAHFQVLIKMANVIITLKIMPESPDTDLEAVKQKASGLIASFGGNVGKDEIEPVAFGLNALKLTFVSDEAKGSTDSLEADINNLEDVASVEVIDVRRAVG